MMCLVFQKRLKAKRYPVRRSNYWFNLTHGNWKGWSSWEGERPKYEDPGDCWVRITIRQAREYKDSKPGTFQHFVWSRMPDLVGGQRRIWKV